MCPIIKIGLDRDLALAVKTIDLGRSRLEDHIGHRAKRHSSAAHGRHGQGLDGFKIGARRLVQAHPDGNPAARIIIFGHIGINIADGRNTSRERNGLS